MAADGPKPRAPQHRPTWMVLVAAIMLISAARMGLAGLFALIDQAQTGTQTALVVSAEDAASRAVELAVKAVRERHDGLVRAQAAVQVAVALLLLYVVAAVFTLDPRGRRLALLAAWVSVIYHLANVAFGLLVLRPAIVEVAPEVVAQIAVAGEAATDLLLPTLRALAVALPVMTGIVGLLFSLLIFVFFGGSRGRTLYGLEADSREGGVA